MKTKMMSGQSLMTDGIIGLVAGLVLLFFTGMSQNLIVIAFAGYAAILGVTQMLAATGETDNGRGTTYFGLLGFYSLAAGVGLLFFTGAALATVITLVGVYIVVTGIAEAVAAMLYREELNGYAWLVGSGVVRTLFGLFLLFNTGLVLSTLILYMAIYAIVEGVVISVLGYEIRTEIGKFQRPMLQ
jgi:uncharacterized membrane protein HdeD (DUF308 family)